MSIPLFLAMTSQEIRENICQTGKIAYMACHFSPKGSGVTNLPENMPPTAMLILDDRIPYGGQSAEQLIAGLRASVERLGCQYVLLDFERPATKQLQELSAAVANELPCPVAMPPEYARALDCPLFLPSIPPYILPEDYLSPYKNREIWLEAALDGALATVTAEGCQVTAVPYPETAIPLHHSRELRCHYHMDITDKAARVTFLRSAEDIGPLLEAAEQYGAALAIGLHQELSGIT